MYKRQEYAQACQQFYDNGIKPYSLDLAEDWSAHEVIQTGAIGEFMSLDGIEWRSAAESASGDIAFDDTLWKRIFSETNTFLKDSHFTSDDINVDVNTAAQRFLEGKAAMFHGYPALMQEYQEQMDAELTRIPFFSQISDEAFINMTPSLNIAFNKDLEKDQEKLDLAFDVLDCMISKEGQTLIADGKGVISLNVDVPNMMEDVPGLENEINNNSVYIRYSAQKSFDASLKAVHGLLSGEMDETQAYDAFRSTMNRKDSKEKTTVNFENEYAISLNDKNGRDAASSILTTIREENDAQLALVPYYYFTSSIYKGECTGSRVALMTAKSSDAPLYLAKINGKEVYELAEKYLADSDEKFHVTNKYELPIASGMKIIVSQEENGFSLQDIEVNKKKTDKDKEYSILLTDTTMSVLKKINPECEICLLYTSWETGEGDLPYEEEAMRAHAKEMVFPIGAPNDGFAQYFSGRSFLAPISTSQVGIFNVTFEPGCRNNWHIHHAKSGGGQILVCVAGRGFYQEEGRDAVEMKPGDCINIPVDVKHWHGAAPDEWFSHLAIEVPGVDCSNEWCEAVSEKEYAGLR